MKGIQDIAVMHTKVEIKGTCSDQFTPVREAFAHNLDTGEDIGASVAVFVDGDPVVDLWGGHFDGTYTRPFERDTIAQGCSSTKTITALCAMVLADRGDIDLDARMAIGFVPNRWIGGPHETARSGNIVRAAYQALRRGR